MIIDELEKCKILKTGMMVIVGTNNIVQIKAITN